MLILVAYFVTNTRISNNLLHTCLRHWNNIIIESTVISLILIQNCLFTWLSYILVILDR